MSLVALLTAVRDELIADATIVSWINSRNCSVRGGRGRPPFVFGGPLYVAVVPTDWGVGGPESNNGVAEGYAVDVVLTMRTGRIPDDKLMGEAFLKAITGLDPRARSIMTLMAKFRFTDGAAGGILTRANNAISETDKVVEPFRWLGNDPQPEPVGPDWFSSDPSPNDLANAFGWRYALHYGESKRFQAIPTMG